MTNDKTVLVLALGPVQDFIARARRTRDLWFGSHVLSELSRAAARSLAEEGWELVFPPLHRGGPSLDPVDGRLAGGQPASAIVNRIVAVGGKDPEGSAERARASAIGRWRTLARQAHTRASALLRKDVGLGQLEDAVEDLLEFYAAWGTGAYTAVRHEIDAELAARKLLRDFGPWLGGDARPKSSLDGFRETVLLKPEDRNRDADGAARLGRLGDGEQLDEIGFVKRFGGSPEQFPSVARVAVQPWVATVLEKPNPDVQAEWDAVKDDCAKGGVGRLDSAAATWASMFPYDGEVFFRDRWPAIQDESEFRADNLDNLLERLGSPSAYVAVIAADGDGMGAALDRIGEDGSHQRHAEFSARLARFAAETRNVVEEHGGALVYAGGDDVLALVPVTSAPETAAALRRSFGEILGVDNGPTLSVGIGIGHFLSPLGELVALAQHAERLAKGNELPPTESRNALAIVLDKRGGAPIEWRCRWPDEPVEKLRGLANAIADGHIPTAFAYEIRDDVLKRLVVFELRDALSEQPATARSLPPPFDEILRDEIRRTWQRKRDSMQRLGATGRPESIPALDVDTATVSSVESWVAAFGIAKHFSEQGQTLQRVHRKAR